VNEYL